jgi:hydrogenase/urease accessory protein HupE
VAATLLLAVDAGAHEVRPGYLELRQIGGGTYEVLFKVPARGDLRMGLHVRFPPNCTATEPARRLLGGAFIDRLRVTCDGGLIGGRVVVDGLAETRTDVLARIERADGTTQVVRLTPADPAFTVVDAPGATEVARTYFGLGVHHILLGFDHLLFVLALLLVVRNWPRLIKTVTAFTLAHSLTLAAATLGWVHVPQKPVEAAIALSIAFVAADILRAQAGRESLTTRAPWIMAFAFGLLHGLGFAGALSEVGLPPGDIPVALLFFNLGVEAGQLTFIAGALLVVTVLRRVPARFPRWAARAPAYAIGALAMFWVVQRVMTFS